MMGHCWPLTRTMRCHWHATRFWTYTSFSRQNGRHRGSCHAHPRIAIPDQGGRLHQGDGSWCYLNNNLGSQHVSAKDGGGCGRLIREAEEGARRAADLGFDEAVALALEYPGAIPAMQNGILIVEFANKLQEEGQAKVD